MFANDPHTAQFISTEIARHFVSDNPPEALVDAHGKGLRENRRRYPQCSQTMIYSPEFWSKDAYRDKVKKPFEMVASTARALNADVAVSLPLVQWIGRMGEPLFLCQPPTGYSDKAEKWVNTGALLNRLNFALQFASNRMPGAKRGFGCNVWRRSFEGPGNSSFECSAIFFWIVRSPRVRARLSKQG